MNKPLTNNKEHSYEAQHGFYRPCTSSACRCCYRYTVLYRSNYRHSSYHSWHHRRCLLVDKRNRVLPIVPAAEALDNKKERCLITTICSLSRKNCATTDHNSKSVEGNWNLGDRSLSSGKPQELL